MSDYTGFNGLNDKQGTKSSAYTMISLEAYAVTPIHQGTFWESIRKSRHDTQYNNFSPIRTTEMFTPTGWMEIPTISGNSLRGRLRRAATLDFFAIIKDTLGNSPFDKLQDKYAILSDTERFALQLLMSGGSLKGKDNKDDGSNAAGDAPDADGPDALPTEQLSPAEKKAAAKANQQIVALSQTLNRSEIEQLFPMLAVFGYGDGFDRMAPGSIAVTDLVPLLTETQDLLAEWDGLALDKPDIIPSWNDLLTKGKGNGKVRWPRQAATRVDPATATFNSYSGIKNGRGADETMTQMAFMAEYLPAGVRLYGGLYLHESLTDIERGMIYVALDRLLADGFIGGQKSRGYGRVKWSATAPDDKEMNIAAYRKHVATSASRIGEIVPTMVTKGPAKSK